MIINLGNIGVCSRGTYLLTDAYIAIVLISYV
jgi:hypothetical protein